MVPTGSNGNAKEQPEEGLSDLGPSPSDASVCASVEPLDLAFLSIMAAAGPLRPTVTQQEAFQPPVSCAAFITCASVPASECTFACITIW